MSDDVLLARALLSRVAEPAGVAVWALVRERGPLAAVAAIRDGSADSDVRDAVAARLPTVDPAADLEAAARHGVRLVVPESDEWPHFAMACLEQAGRARLARYRAGERATARGGEPIPPLALWVRGEADLASLGTRSVALVGARSATAYGEHVAADLSYGLARQGATIVSGGAYGIDAAAHRGALGAGGETVLVSAGGLDRAYPPSHASLFERCVGSGLLVSESPPGAAPQRRRFLTRNRLIAALSGGCVVVEAAARSGAINTARHARHLGRPLMVVPGPVTSAQSVGCHQLLQMFPDTTHLVTSVRDVLSVVGGAPEPPGDVAGAPAGGGTLREALDALDDTARALYDGLPAGRRIAAADLAVTAGMHPLQVIRALPALEVAQLVEIDADGSCRRVRPPRARASPADCATRVPGVAS